MSKIKKGIKILVTQGPAGVYRKVKSKAIAKRELEEFKKSVKEVHLITEEQRKKQKETVFSNPVKFSIITPLYNTPEKYLVELVESLKKQTYSNWELCLADGSDEEHSYVGEMCKKWNKEDSRIVYQKLKENRGISHNTNACIEISSGEYLGLLDHDDILHESALFEMMSYIDKYDADFLYSDEVKFSGRIEDATDFNFKPDFGKDELRSHNYICHFTAFSKELLDKIGQVYRPEFDGSQDHDMVLRLSEQAKRIIHIPKVLYYWRVHPQSVSMNLDSKEYAVDAAIRAVQEQVDRTKEYGEVASNLPYRTIYRTKYKIDKNSKILIIIHNLKTEKEFDDLKNKISLLTDYPDLEFAPAGLGNKDSLGKQLNEIIEKSTAQYCVVMDALCTPVNPDWVDELLMFAQRQDVAAVSPKVLSCDGSILYAGIALEKAKEEKIRFLCQGINDSEQGYEAILRYVRNTTAVWKGCFMVKKDVVTSLGGFTEDILGYEDIDFSLNAVEHNLYNVWTCFAVMEYHDNSIADFAEGDSVRFAEKWQKKLEKRDPYYHENWKKFKLV